MSILSRFDIRTILACQVLLSFAFAIVFFAMSWAYRRLHGLSAIAIGFLLDVPGALLLAQRGTISDFASIIIANALIIGGHLYLYFGVLRFFAGERKPHPAGIWISSSSAFAAIVVITWYSMMQHNIVPRILAAAIFSGLIFALIAIELLRNAKGRIALRLFALFALLHTAVTIYRTLGTLWLGAPQNFMHPNSVQALSMISNLILISGLGIFFQLMIAGELTEAVEHRARHDLLTGVLNRSGIEERLSTELDRALRNRHSLSALLIDVDRFKSINDSAGHAAGDDALRLVSKSISSSLRSYDLLGRYGGDEFLLLLPETSATQAIDVADRTRSLLAIAAQSLSPSLRPTVSIGIAQTQPADSITSLLARADAALYDAKLAGRNCVRKRDSSSDHPGVVAAEKELVREPLNTSSGSAAFNSSSSTSPYRSAPMR